jgi:hypothetical protein
MTTGASAANGLPASVLSAQDLLAGGRLVHEVPIPSAVLVPVAEPTGDESLAVVRLRPLNVATLMLISRAAREDASLVPLLMIKESLLEPALSLDQIRQMHVGLVHFLIGRINIISGLTADGAAIAEAVEEPTSRAYLLLAKHFGWTPEQVSQLTPGQVALYLAGVETLLRYEEARR